MSFPSGYSEDNFTSLLQEDATFWHDGSGLITYAFAYEIPDDYVTDLTYVIGEQAFTAETSPLLDPGQVAATESAVDRLNEIANLNLVAAGGETVDEDEGGASTPGGSAMMTGLGGPRGYGEIAVPRSDDGYVEYSLGRVFEDGFNFFGTTWRSFYVNTNGSITFGQGLMAYNASSLSQGIVPMIAPFLADVDTRAGARLGAESGQIYVDFDTQRDRVTITWDEVNFYDRNGSRQNSFQLQLVDRGNGNADILFRYGDIAWTTGDASGGSSGVGGVKARAGFTSGDGQYFYELPASGLHRPLLTLEDTAGNTGTLGYWRFSIRNGAPVEGNITVGAVAFDSTLSEGVSYGAEDGSLSGDVWLNGAADYGTEEGVTHNFAWRNLMLKLGETLGLSSPGDGALEDSHDSIRYTMMSRNGLTAIEEQDVADMTFAATPMLYDIQALQAQYGPNMSTRLGDTVYFSGVSEAEFRISDNGRMIATIWDAGGIDTFSAADQSTSAVIDLRPGAFSSIGELQDNIAIARGVHGTQARAAWIENAIGSDADDLLIGNGVSNTLQGGGGEDLIHGANGDDLLEGGAGNDNMLGGNGEDVLRDGTGTDRLMGGPGADHFILDADGMLDVILDFEPGVDLITLVSAETASFDALGLLDLGDGRVRLVYDDSYLVIQGLRGNFDSADLSAEDFLFALPEPDL